MEAPDSFERAFPGLYGQARAVAWRILGDPTDAEDAAAEALIRALLQWSRIQDQTYRDAWIMGITIHVALDMARRRGRSRVVAGPVPDQPAASDTEVVVLRSALVAALTCLPRRQREAIALVHLVGFTPGEAAAAMRVSPSSVSQHLRRGLDRLRGQLGELPPQLHLVEGSA